MDLNNNDNQNINKHKISHELAYKIKNKNYKEDNILSFAAAVPRVIEERKIKKKEEIQKLATIIA